MLLLALAHFSVYLMYAIYVGRELEQLPTPGAALFMWDLK